MAMGNGDRNTGLDLLKRAYFGGEPDALALLTQYFPAKDWSEP